MGQPVKPVPLTTCLGPIVPQVGLIFVRLMHCEGFKFPGRATSVFTRGYFWPPGMYGFVLF